MDTNTTRWLYHATDKANLPKISGEGMRKGSYWTNDEDIRDYYSETVCDDGCEPVILGVDIDSLDKDLIAPDHNSLSEPLTYTLKCSEEDINEQWEASKQGWEDSLSIVKSIRYKGAIQSLYIFVLDGSQDPEPLADYIIRTAKSSRSLGTSR